jgi:uncharacterized OsmC-like protein
MEIELGGAVLDERRKNAILGFIKNCPVHQTLHFNPKINAKIIGQER